MPLKSGWSSVFPLFFLCLAIGCSQDARLSSSTPIAAKASEESSPVLLPVKVSGKWGYINTSGQLVINPQFDYADEFHEGRAMICLGKPCSWWDAENSDERWGFIDSAGKIIVTPQYGKAEAFSEGLAQVCTGGCALKSAKPASRGYIDKGGKVVIPMQFGIARSFSEGLAQVCVGKCEWVEKEGYSGKFGFIDHSGRFVVNPLYDDVWDFKNGFAKVILGKGDDAKTGYIDITGKVVWQPSN